MRVVVRSLISVCVSDSPPDFGTFTALEVEQFVVIATKNVSEGDGEGGCSADMGIVPQGFKFGEWAGKWLGRVEDRGMSWESAVLVNYQKSVRQHLQRSHPTVQKILLDGLFQNCELNH